MPPLKRTQYHLKALQAFFVELADRDVDSSNSGFAADKDAILRVFENTSDYRKEDILVRLTLIDSMYSTQMSRRYYALDELAGVLSMLAGGREGKLKSMFLDFAKNPDGGLSKFDYLEMAKDGKQTTKNLFSECYGIGKNGEDKGVAISLISKYAYFETNLQFPIYDSIACEMYPLVWKHCGFGDKVPKLRVSEKGKVQGCETMIEYVKAINLMIERFDSRYLTYDMLDRFLWFVGKIIRGNLSLVLSRKDYEEMMKKTKREVVTRTKEGKEVISVEYFNIENVDLKDLDYLNANSTLYKFFEFAKFYTLKH